MLTLGCPTPSRASTSSRRAPRVGRPRGGNLKLTQVGLAERRVWRLKAEGPSSKDVATDTTPSAEEPTELENVLDAEQARKKAEADELRSQEQFMVIGAGDATCSNCGYEYLAQKGDPEFPAAKGTLFQDLPDDYSCPLCSAPKSSFKSKAQEIPGFAVNQGYGFGTNSMTAGQKQGLIYGALLVFFFLFLGGYFLD